MHLFPRIAARLICEEIAPCLSRSLVSFQEFSAACRSGPISRQTICSNSLMLPSNAPGASDKISVRPTSFAFDAALWRPGCPNGCIGILSRNALGGRHNSQNGAPPDSPCVALQAFCLLSMSHLVATNAAIRIP
jgi:hypothetical protein